MTVYTVIGHITNAILTIEPLQIPSNLSGGPQMLFVIQDFDFAKQVLWTQLAAKYYPIGYDWTWNAYRWEASMVELLLSHLNSGWKKTIPDEFMKRAVEMGHAGCITKEFFLNLCSGGNWSRKYCLHEHLNQTCFFSG